MPSSQTDFRWLASTEGARWLEELAGEANPGPSLVAKLRRDLSADQTHALLEQIDLRQRGTAKFANAGDMLFTKRSLEQASDQWVAAFKATRYKADAPVLDLCSGIGGDAIASAVGRHCTAVDLDPIMTFLCRHNADVCGAANLTAACKDAAEVIEREGLESEAYWHIDPDRRAGGRQHTRVDACRPGIDTLRRLISQGRGGAIKLAPAADLPAELDDRCELEWISRGRECKQCVAWYGELAAGQGVRTASVLDRQGNLLDRFSAEVNIQPSAAPAETIDGFVYDPDPALLAAGLVEGAAAEMGLLQIDLRSRYLTSDRHVGRNIWQVFRVLEVLPLDVRRLKQVLSTRRIGTVEWKKRGAEVDLTQFASRCKVKGEESGAVIISPYQDRTIAILCERA